jgi:hypothetical protein
MADSTPADVSAGRTIQSDTIYNPIQSLFNRDKKNLLDKS